MNALALLKRAVMRYLNIHTYKPYEQFLQRVTAYEDVWVTSQGAYMTWWHQRLNTNFTVTATDQGYTATVDLADAVIEKYPHTFYEAQRVHIPGTPSHTGPLWITIDPKLDHKEILKEALRREGILNFVEADSGPLYVSKELTPTLQAMATALREERLADFHQAVGQIRDRIFARCQQNHLPLFRIWYHPLVRGRRIRAIVSPRYDVDRAITNMPKIWQLEHKYQAQSTAHLRAFSPFYSQRTTQQMACHTLCSDIALHGEFTRNALAFGGVLEAALAERAQLEAVTGREVLGVSLHGGELVENNNRDALAAIADAGFLYDVSLPPQAYYFPYRRLTQGKQLESTYRIRFNFGDLALMHSKNYTADFIQRAMQVFDEVYTHCGILVMMLHPIYFGFWPYMLNVENTVRLLGFLPIYLKRLLVANKVADLTL